MQYGGVCVGGGPVDPLRTVFERAVSVGGVGGRAAAWKRGAEHGKDQGAGWSGAW